MAINRCRRLKNSADFSCFTARGVTHVHRFPNSFFALLHISVPSRLYSADTDLVNPLTAELNPIRHLLALVGARHIVHVSRIRVNWTVKLDFLLII